MDLKIRVRQRENLGRLLRFNLAQLGAATSVWESSRWGMNKVLLGSPQLAAAREPSAETSGRESGV